MARKHPLVSASSASRRRLLVSGAWFAGALAAPSALHAAAALVPTPRQPPGPFYPVSLPLDSDNDLVSVAGRPSRAAGTVTHVFGRVLDLSGRPIRGGRVEIWQCDNAGRYHHPRDRGGNADPNFQGYGQAISSTDGEFRFRTIRPTRYPGRTPHIHFTVSGPDFERLVTQMYVKGEPTNDRDFLYQSIGDPGARESVTVDLGPAPELEAGALAGEFQIVLGHNALREAPTGG